MDVLTKYTPISDMGYNTDIWLKLSRVHGSNRLLEQDEQGFDKR